MDQSKLNKRLELLHNFSQLSYTRNKHCERKKNGRKLNMAETIFVTLSEWRHKMRNNLSYRRYILSYIACPS